MKRLHTLLTFFFVLVVCLKNTPKVYICSSVYCDEKGNESIFPNSYNNHKSSSLTFQKVYWECATVMFASSLRCNPEATHLLFTNKKKAPSFCKDILCTLGVTVITLPFRHLPPNGWHHAYKNSVYTLDMIQYLSSVMNDDDIAIVLDADTLWIRSCQNLLQEIGRCGSMQFHITYPEEHIINGLSLKDARPIYELLLNKKIERTLLHTGGEIVAATGFYIKQMAQEIDPLWDYMLERFKQKQKTFNTEEHFLSFIYEKLQIQHNAAHFIRRIGTDESVLRTVNGKELDLTIWHLPAEKHRGFKLLFELIKDNRSSFWTTELDTQFPILCGKTCHIIK
jgi:hypothetical protein